MRIIYFFLVFIFATFISQAQAFDLGETLKDVVKESTTGKTTSTSNATGSEGSKKAFNWKSPSPQEEIQIGREITGNLLGASPLVKDAALQKYVNQVGRWVANQSERADLPWHFGVIESEDINAFAAPGGYVIITKGLYRKLENEAQLAGGAFTRNRPRCQKPSPKDSAEISTAGFGCRPAWQTNRQG